MEFEYNRQKSQVNREKHGIDFEEAKNLWRKENVVLPAITRGDNRYMMIGKIGEFLYSCIFTIRGESIRIISCRKSREKEKGIYHEKTEEKN